MKHFAVVFVFFALCSGCYRRQDPLVRAAQDLQYMADQFAAQEDDKIQRFNSLRLGMSKGEVIKQLGAPATQQILTNSDEIREQWTYRGAMRPLGTLTFANDRLVEIRAE
jgi:outer membrane protein assembly factor BamE (lipoprotein component of BamABCDE complex)